MRKWMTTMAIAVLAAAPVFAGSYEKCDGDTQECLDYMANKMKNSGWVGVELEHTDQGGLAVSKVVDRSPAEKAGIEAGDVLVAINGIEYSEANQKRLMEQKQASKPGDSITWTVKRAGYNKDLKITLGRMPADMLARYIGEHMMQHTTTEVAEN